MAKGSVVGIFISPKAREPMREVSEVFAEAGNGLVGDRYYDGNGSYNHNKPGKRQVTLMNALFFKDSEFCFADSRRNIFTEGVELMDLIDKEFKVGEALFKGVKYCDPCQIPSKLAGIETSFRDAFFDRGGLVAEILESSIIFIGDEVLPPKKVY
ncbi:MAG: hypothetical protein RLZZ480_638 [Candidatus Parcubacteria bacterium]|jgi:MOSC domain-containing protein YiiM